MNEDTAGLGRAYVGSGRACVGLGRVCAGLGRAYVGRAWTPKGLDRPDEHSRCWGFVPKSRYERPRAEIRCNLDTKALRYATQIATGAVGGCSRSSKVLLPALGSIGRIMAHRRITSLTSTPRRMGLCEHGRRKRQCKECGTGHHALADKLETRAQRARTCSPP